jgi:hypothetical protein
MYKPKDSGLRTKLKTGSHKEIVKGRGRYDLMPLKAISDFLTITNKEKIEYQNNIALLLNEMHAALIADIIENKIVHLSKVIEMFIKKIMCQTDFYYIQKLAIMYEAGANKYAERDWEKGRPMLIFIDSALRHLFQYLNNETDEDHSSAFVWNIISCIDTIRRMPSMAYILKEKKE